MRFRAFDRLGYHYPPPMDLRALAFIMATAAASGIECGARPFSPAPVVVLPREVRASMSGAWIASNIGWRDVHGRGQSGPGINSGPRELLACLVTDVGPDTVFVRGWKVAANLKQFAMTASGDCLADNYGTFHTHPYLVTPDGEHYSKARSLSDKDLSLFAKDQTLDLMVVMWDVDSIDVAIRARDGSIIHPAPLVVR